MDPSITFGLAGVCFSTAPPVVAEDYLCGVGQKSPPPSPVVHHRESDGMPANDPPRHQQLKPPETPRVTGTSTGCDRNVEASTWYVDDVDDDPHCLIVRCLECHGAPQRRLRLENKHSIRCIAAVAAAFAYVRGETALRYLVLLHPHAAPSQIEHRRPMHSEYSWYCRVCVQATLVRLLLLSLLLVQCLRCFCSFLLLLLLLVVLACCQQCDVLCELVRLLLLLVMVLLL